MSTAAAAAPAAGPKIAHFRCYSCDKLLAADATACACGGGPGPTFGLRLDGDAASDAGPAPADAGAAAPTDAPPASDRAPDPVAVAPSAAARRVRAGSRLSGELLLRLPRWERDGRVKLQLLCVARGPQKASNVVRHDLALPLAAGSLHEHGRWPFSVEVPAFPPSHEGVVEIDWYLRATLTPSTGPDTLWTWQLYVLPGAGTPPAERRKNTAAQLAAAFRAFRFVAFPLVVLVGILAAPALGVVRALQGSAEAGGFSLVALLLALFLLAYLGRWFLAGGRRALRYARGWLLPRPSVRRTLRLGEAAPIGLHAGYAWALVRVEEASAREERSGTNGLYRTTVWSYAATPVATGTGSGTLVVPRDAPPSLATWTRRIRWELRVWPRERPDLWHAHGVEVLSEYASGAGP